MTGFLNSGTPKACVIRKSEGHSQNQRGHVFDMKLLKTKINLARICSATMLHAVKVKSTLSTVIPHSKQETCILLCVIIQVNYFISS